MLSDVMNMGAQTNLHKEHVNLRDLLESVCREVLSIYQRSDVTILFDIGPTKELYVDRAKIKRVLSNIVTNAIQAMGSNENIIFRAKMSKDSELELELSNTGSHINEDKLSNIFDSFYTFGKKSGTGLGLAIAKKFIEAHGGSIFCMSSEKKNEVSFYMTLPVDKRSLDVAPISRKDSQISII